MASGCSFALVSGPPDNHRQLPIFDCTTSRVGPALDTVWSILQVLNFTAAAVSTDQEWNAHSPLSRQVALPLYVGLGSLGIAGMYYGFTRTSQCRGAKNELTLRIMQGGGPTQPGTWPPPTDPASMPSGPPAPPAPPESPEPPASSDPQ
jgi:hypothetical protein